MAVLPEEINPVRSGDRDLNTITEYIKYMRERVEFAFAQEERQRKEILSALEGIQKKLYELEAQ